MPVPAETVKGHSASHTFTTRDLQRAEPRSFWSEDKARAWHAAKTGWMQSKIVYKPSEETRRDG